MADVWTDKIICRGRFPSKRNPYSRNAGETKELILLFLIHNNLARAMHMLVASSIPNKMKTTISNAIIYFSHTGCSLNIVFFPKNVVIFLNSASSAVALVFYLAGVCTHTDTERKQSPEHILKSLNKNNI